MAIKNSLQGHKKLAQNLRRELGRELKARREELGMTLQEVAVAVGYDYYNYIYAVESGKGSIASERYVEWARALKMDPKIFAKRMLATYDPWSYDILFGSGEGRVEAEAASASA